MKKQLPIIYSSLVVISLLFGNFNCIADPCVTQTVNNPQAICPNGSYTFNGHTYSVAGDYNDTLLSYLGCDSIIVTQLTINSLPSVTANASSTTSCHGDKIILTGSGHDYQSVLDQYCADANNGSSLGALATSYSQGQSFTAGISGDLKMISIGLSGSFLTPIPGTLLLKVYSGEGLSTAPIFTGTYSGINPVYVVYQGYIFTELPITGVQVIAGQKYTFEVFTAGNTTQAGISTQAGNPYAGGVHYSFGSPDANSDLAFSTTVAYHTTYNWNHNVINGVAFLPSTQYYTVSYTDSVTGCVGKDSILITRVIPDTLHQSVSICNGDNFTFYGSILTTNGTYYHTVDKVAGCDSVCVVLALTVNPTYSKPNPQTICSNAFYTINGHSYNTAGTYNDTLQTVVGCDSVIVTTITVNTAPTVIATASQTTVCDGAQIQLRGASTGSTGAVDQIQSIVASDFSAQAGLPIGESFTAGVTGSLDSIAVKIYQLSPNDPGDIRLVIYNGEGTAGTVIHDSTYTISVTANITSNLGISNVNIVAGQKYTFEIYVAGATTMIYIKSGGGDFYSGGIMYYFGAFPGDDLSFTTYVTPPAPAYTWNNGVTDTVAFVPPVGNRYYTVSTVDNINGCVGRDSILIKSGVTDTTLLAVSICNGDSYTFNSVVYSNSDTAFQTLTNANGCDSVINFILTVNPTYAVSNPQTICANDVYVVNGNSYNIAATYVDTMQTVSGCDSIITTVLTVLPVDTTMESLSICTNDSLDFYGTYVSAVGTYYYTLANSVTGCDSIIELTLTHTPSPVITAESGDVTACGDVSASFTVTSPGVNWYQWYYGETAAPGNSWIIDGSYTEVNFTTDSMTIDSLVTGDYNGYFVFCVVTDTVTGCSAVSANKYIVVDEIDLTVITNYDTLFSAQSGAVYQWINCDNGDSAIVGETNSWYNATQSGNYAVVITNGACYDTSACTSIIVTGVKNISNLTSQISISPNPNNGLFTVIGSDIKSIKVINAIGQVVFQSATNSQQSVIDISNEASGIYMLQVLTDAGTTQHRIVKQ